MKNSLKTAIDTRLAELDWQGQGEVLAKIRAPRRRVGRLRGVAIACILMVFASATALALTLEFSQRYGVIRQARSAVSAQYGLTDEMLDLFSAQAHRIAGGWLVSFEPLNLDKQAMGSYQVLCRPDGTAEASWSHDGEQNAEDKPWGAAEMARVIALRRANAQAWNDKTLGLYEEMTLAERAALDAPLLEEPQSSAIINIAPKPSDISPQAAEQLAREAVAVKYGVSPEILASYTAELSFLLISGEDAREYRISLINSETRSCAYQVYVLSPSGEVRHCKWWVEPEARTLPPGELADYPEAALEYVKSGAFELLSPEEKALAAQRFNSAGFRDWLPRADYLAPQAGDMLENAALGAARQALMEVYGFETEGFDFFACRTSLIAEAGERRWQVTFLPREQPNWHWRDFEKLGTYTVLLSAGDGRVISAEWSLDNLQGLAAYTPETFGGASGYSAPMLPWLSALLERLDSILQKYPASANLDEFTLEDRAAYDTLMREAGYDPRQHAAVLPKAGELAEQAAVLQASQALAAATAWQRNSCRLARPG